MSKGLSRGIAYVHWSASLQPPRGSSSWKPYTAPRARVRIGGTLKGAIEGRDTYLGVDVAFHGPGPGFKVVPSSSADVPSSRFRGGTRASSMQNMSSHALARSGVRGVVGLPCAGDAGCDNFRLVFGDAFGCVFGCERTIGQGISCSASHAWCWRIEAAR